jgi:rhodanese-related sulfurtransferase
MGHQNREAVIVDVREKDEWDGEHIPNATHLSRGTIELDIEEKVPDLNRLIICHCGGGGRSALAAESLQKMGYKNVRSMAGGFKAWKAAGLPNRKIANRRRLDNGQGRVSTWHARRPT